MSNRKTSNQHTSFGMLLSLRDGTRIVPCVRNQNFGLELNWARIVPLVLKGLAQHQDHRSVPNFMSMAKCLIIMS